jgi:hypothetical protein
MLRGSYKRNRRMQTRAFYRAERNRQLQIRDFYRTEKFLSREAERIYRRFNRAPKNSLGKYVTALFEAHAETHRLFYSMQNVSVAPYLVHMDSLVEHLFDAIAVIESDGLLTLTETESQLTIVTRYETVTLTQLPRLADHGE